MTWWRRFLRAGLTGSLVTGMGGAVVGHVTFPRPEAEVHAEMAVLHRSPVSKCI